MLIAIQDQTIRERVIKLLALANSGNTPETQLAREKANSLISRFGVEVQEAPTVQPKAKAKFDWVWWLGVACAAWCGLFTPLIFVSLVCVLYVLWRK